MVVMKNYILNTLILASFLSFYSCAPIKYPNRQGLYDLKKDLSVLNGNYQNFRIDTVVFAEVNLRYIDTLSLWAVLTTSPKEPQYTSKVFNPIAL